jgi:hypothetical protein
MADGSYNHTAWGVLEREWAGFPVLDAHLRAELPENLERIATFDELPLIQAIHARTWDHFVLRGLPEFRCVVTAPDLPGWTVLQRGPETCESAEATKSPAPDSAVGDSAAGDHVVGDNAAGDRAAVGYRRPPSDAVH